MATYWGSWINLLGQKPTSPHSQGRNETGPLDWTLMDEALLWLMFSWFHSIIHSQPTCKRQIPNRVILSRGQKISACDCSQLGAIRVENCWLECFPDSSVQILEWSPEFSWGGRGMQSIAVHKLCQTQKLPSQVCTLRVRNALYCCAFLGDAVMGHVGQLSKTGTDPWRLSWRFLGGGHTHGSWHNQRAIVLRKLKKFQAANFIGSVPCRFFHETCWFVTIFNLD